MQLREILGVGQDRPQTARRWFHSDYFDLFVTQKPDGELTSFELCYGGHASERALVWDEHGGYFHDGVETSTSEQPLLGAGLIAGGPLEADPIVARLQNAVGGLPDSIRTGLESKLREYAALGAPAAARRKRYRRDPWQAEAKTG